MSATERHYTPAEIAKLWALSEESVRRLFRDRPDVLRINYAAGLTRKRRRYVTLRIPESTLTRVHQERTRGVLAEISGGKR